MNKLLIAMVSALVAAPLFGAAEAEDIPKELRIVTEGAYAPWNFTKPDGTLDGFEIDLAHDLCGRLKVTCVITAQAYDSIIPSLNAGKYDAIMAAMSVTAKREEVIAFTRSYGSTGQTFATTKENSLASLPDSGQLFSLASNEAGSLAEIEKLKPLLKGKRIGVQGGSISEAFMTKHFGDTVTLTAYKSTEQHDLDLMAERIDAVMTSPAYLMTATKKPGNENMVMVGPRFQGGMLGRGSAVGVRKSDVALRDALDGALKAAQADGTIERLSDKWFGFDVTPR